MVCPGCNRFPSKDTDTEPEGELEIDADGTVTGDIRIVNTCAECGEELEESTFSVEIDLTEEIAKHKAEKHPQTAEPKKPVKQPPLRLTNPYAMCRHCKMGYRMHVDPKTNKSIGELPKKWPNDAHKCRCIDAKLMIDNTGKRGTTFEPKGSTSGDGDMELSVDADLTRTDEMQTKDRRGKPIKSSRYMKRLYGIHADVTVTCDTCKEEIATGTFDAHVQASGMESLV